MLGWLRSLLRQPPPPKSAPRSSAPQKSRVVFDDTGVTCYRPDGLTESVTWDDLRQVEVVTTDQGPFVEDVFFALFGAVGGCVVPQEAEGCKELLERLQKLPGFNHQAVIDAMCCCSNARFIAWEKDRAA